MLFTRALHQKASLILPALLLATVVSCNENDQSNKRRDHLAPQSMPDMQPKGVMAPAKSDPNFANIPADAQWTIYCQAIGGPNHVELANGFKSQLLKSTSMKDWYVIHEESQSVIYYGFYRAIDTSDAKEAQRARADQKDVQSMSDQSGDRLFPHCFFVEVTTPDPAAPAEWNLANANGYWSLQIAAYKDSPQRKQYAVDAVKEARAQGLPAYFLHGENTSMVFIGAWPRSAVKEQDESSGSAPDPTQPLLVLSQPTNITDVRDRDGNAVRTLAPRLEPLDPSMIEALQKYPNNVVNGMVNLSRVKDPVTKQEMEIPDPSFLVAIPKKQPSLLDSGMPAASKDTTITAPPGVLSPPASSPPAQQPLGGKLRSLQD
jgi:hypothetical protein